VARVARVVVVMRAFLLCCSQCLRTWLCISADT
jgi:hypothetical protein